MTTQPLTDQQLASWRKRLAIAQRTLNNIRREAYDAAHQQTDTHDFAVAKVISDLAHEAGARTRDAKQYISTHLDAREANAADVATSTQQGDHAA